jgi:hypothetical protein
MKMKSFNKDLFKILPLVFSGLLCISVILLLYQKYSSSPEFGQQLSNLTTIFLSISGFLSALILAYLTVAVIDLKKNRTSVVGSLNTITQKMHNFRSIVELLMQSKMWLPGLKEYIDEEYDGLTFFEVKEFYKGKSKLAIEFLQESHNYGETENLYLELKSLLMSNTRDKKVIDDITYPAIYNRDIVGKWLEHKCGSGLWYYFGYKYGAFKESLNLEAVFERHQDKIMTLANTIDSEAFEDSSFNEVFLSKLGEYMSKEVMPKLYQLQETMGSKLPRVMRYLYIIFLMLVVFGVLLPIFYLLFNLPIIILIISYALVVSVIFYISTTLYQFLSSEIDS